MTQSSTQYFADNPVKQLKEREAEPSPVPASSHSTLVGETELSTFNAAQTFPGLGEPPESQLSATDQAAHQVQHRQECFATKLSSYNGENMFEPVERPLDKLCVHCQNVFVHWDKISRDRRGRFEHCESEDALKASAEGGCGLCAQFLKFGQERRGISYYDIIGEDGRFPSGGVLVLRSGCRNDYWRIGLFFTATPDDEISDYTYSSNSILPSSLSDKLNHISYRVFTVDMSPAPHLASLYDAPQASSRSTKDALPLSRIWLRQCTEEHSHTTEEHQSPTRLIFIGDNEVRLTLAKELGECPKYATLSHCWGSVLFETLKVGSLEAFRKRLPATALTKTFRDAIDTSRYFGFQYLWIDSLCIIQDDPNDWDAEASLMADVYGNSSLNIAASGAANGNAGLFFARDRFWRCQIQPKDGDTESLYDCYPTGQVFDLTVSPLELRAWTRQERILPRRTIHFTRTQILWECEKKFSSELYPCDCGGAVQEHDWNCLPKPPFNYHQWMRMVGIYSICKLTYSGDKLVAISGLARESQSRTNGGYVAGLWRNNLEIQLCWFTIFPGYRIAPYVAPTWSWASLDGMVRFDPYGYERKRILHITVLDVQVTHVSQNIFGQISGARLRLLCGYFVRSTIEYSARRKQFLMNLAGMSMEAWNVYFDCFETLQGQIVDAFILPMKSNHSQQMFGLLLEPVGGEVGVYQRIGSFRISQEDFREFKLVYQSGAFYPEHRECVEIHSHGSGKQFVIDII
ncbi:hypothetical protein LCER1_G008094 [Lachnellula cervina]|uniref:Heterokaryon incompatibility domain-containing protein n=1 Tax=Lachnellula cervina TaxID=1316786 RepID=A0A7D8YLW5_9HELO|nr:hypothetical protein LCER1_G008094 [Lachnellula cervina]